MLLIPKVSNIDGKIDPIVVIMIPKINIARQAAVNTSLLLYKRFAPFAVTVQWDGLLAGVRVVMHECETACSDETGVVAE